MSELSAISCDVLQDIYPTPERTPKTYRPTIFERWQKIPFRLSSVNSDSENRRRRPKDPTEILTCAMNKRTIRKLARRGGIKRISVGIYDPVQNAVRSYVEEVVYRAIELVKLKDTKTITALDIVYALNQIGRPIYGFGVFTKVAPPSRAKYMRQKRAEQAQVMAERIHQLSTKDLSAIDVPGEYKWGDIRGLQESCQADLKEEPENL